ncbi:MAG: carboxypeptidase-like regulatory domain-containing protein [Bacteroidetes bacterium]|nr:carboxypeptidase-like regulatory domain-containing protein [Bacteroidota bacterium]MCL6101627.1 carboxypeptidase-like regulatory domain-containing protein [Bacteroidota bacterium]
MLFKKLLFLIVLVGGLSLTGFTQVYFPEDMVKVTAQVRDDLSGLAIPYVNVINQRVRGGTMTDKDGRFALQADPTDTLTFKSLGYIDKRIPVSELINKEIAIVTMAPVRYQLGGVEITGEGPKVNMSGIKTGKMSTVPIELRTEFNTNPKLLTAIFHPTSYLYYKLSKSEKEKRHVLTAIRTEREWQLFSLVYNKQIAERLTGLKGDELDNFMVYFNAFSNLSFSATTYEVEKRVKEVFAEYKEKQLKADTGQ